LLVLQLLDFTKWSAKHKKFELEVQEPVDGQYDIDQINKIKKGK
jgi:hypothetical protein